MPSDGEPRPLGPRSLKHPAKTLIVKGKDMKHSRSVSAAIALFAIASLTACSSGAAKSESSASDAASGDKSITVWVMQDDFTDETLNAINAKFEEETGAKAKVEVQQWDGITTKITTALATSTPPDILDLGNTMVSSFAASGGLLDLTADKADLAAGNTWIGGLEDPATIDGKLYAVPAFAAARAVIYNKQMWADAGITAVPTTWEELTAALDTLAAKHAGEADFSPFYLPGQNWYSGLQFIWDAGGDVAMEEGGAWKGTTSSDKSVEGLKNWMEFQNKYSSEASRTVDTVNPDMSQILAEGKAGAILWNNSPLKKIPELNPELTVDKLGTFPMPGKSGKAQPTMIAGSDWAIAARSQNADLAKKWVKIAASPDIQMEHIFGKQGWIPNSVELLDKAIATPDFPEIQKGFFEAAKNSKATPASPQWATIEGDKSINELFTTLATGAQNPADAAKAFDAHLDEVFGQ